jgi:type IV pilus biogenesis protein CpaD/CtpE
MKRRAFVLTSIAALAAACSRQQPSAPARETPEAANFPDPAETVRPLYERYMDPNATFPALLDQAPWSQAMRAALAAMMVRSEAEQAPVLDFDPFINAQDYQISTATVATEGVVANSHATVRAAFVNAGAPDEILYDLIWEGETWKVDNVRHEGWDLRQIAAGGPG